MLLLLCWDSYVSADGLYILTRGERVIPPIRFTQKRFQVVRGPAHNDHRWGHDGADQQEGSNSCRGRDTER